MSNQIKIWQKLLLIRGIIFFLFNKGEIAEVERYCVKRHTSFVKGKIIVVRFLSIFHTIKLET